MTRTSTAIGLLLPTRSMLRSLSTRSSFTWVGMSISPISSRKIVPPLASSKRPMRRCDAPVKEPFSCPKSSLSISWGERAAQFTATNFC